MILAGLFLALPLYSAMDWDNVKNHKTGTGIEGYDDIEIKNAFGLGKTLWSGSLKKNSEKCGYDCEARIDINLGEEGVLVDEIIFETILEDESKKQQAIRNYQLWVEVPQGEIEVPEYEIECDNVFIPENNSIERVCEEVLIGTQFIEDLEWVEYSIGEVLPAGDYTLKITGDKKPSREVDWVIKTQGEWLKEWAIWGAVYSNLSDDLLAYWTFNETSGDIIDIINGTNNATQVGSPTYSQPGVVGTSIKNNDNSGFYVGGGSTTLSNLSISGWVKINGNIFDSNTGIIWNFEAGTEDYALKHTDSTSINLNGGDNGAGAAIYNGQVNTGDWFHVVMTFNKTDIIYYINGTEVNHDSGFANDIPFDFSTSSFGKRTTDNLRDANVNYDEIGIWNRTLESSDVLELYNSGLGNSYPYSVSGGSVNLEYPVDNYETNSTSVEFNCSASIVGANLVNISLWTNESGTWDLTQYNNITGIYNSSNFSQTFNEGNYTWSCQACDSDGDCGFATENRTLIVDLTPPQIYINLPVTLSDYGFFGKSETLNWTINEFRLGDVWFDYNGTNTTIYGNYNETTFFLDYSPLNLTLWANDSVGNYNSSFVEWDYKVFKNSFEYNNETLSGAVENFTLNITLGSGISLTSAKLLYNTTEISADIYANGQDRIISVENYELPLVTTDVTNNISWILSVTGGDVQTENSSQLVQAVLIDNCSSYTYEIFNVSLFDEATRTSLKGDIEFNLDLLNVPNYNSIGNLTTLFEDVNDTQICSEVNFTSLNLAYALEIRYSSDGYASEFYHIQRGTFGSELTKINLFDLYLNDSTEFKITYQDSSYSFVDDAIIQLQRKYISEGIYEVVESPLTSNDGVALVHIDLDTNKYKATIVKDGVILDIFDNLVFKCDSELTGECEQKLLGDIDPNNDINLDQYQDFSYTEPTLTNNSITLAFTIPSGTPSSVNVVLEQKDQFGNKTLCNKTIISSAGSIECEYSETLDRSYIDLSVLKDGELLASKSYIIKGESYLDWANNNYLFMFILLLSLVGMAFTSPEWMIINGVVTFVISGGLLLARGLDFVAGLGILIWIVISAIIFIVKISKQEDK